MLQKSDYGLAISVRFPDLPVCFANIHVNLRNDKNSSFSSKTLCHAVRYLMIHERCKYVKYNNINNNTLMLFFFSTFGSLMFTFGSVLLWAVLRSILPQNVTLCSLIGLSSGVTLIRVGQNYLDFVDSQLEIDGSA